MKLPEPIAKLVQEVLAKHAGAVALDKDVKENPELYLVSLLLAIKERLPNVSATLDYTVERAVFESYLKDARKYLEK